MTMLTNEQAELFFDTMDALLIYVNERFRVVEGFTLDYNDQIGDMKAAIVARTLWENVEVIDAFVQENPYRLSQRCLELALSWKTALPGVYTLVRYQQGNAILMNDVGVFSLSGVTLDLEGEIGKAPAYVEIVLIPFEGVIVYDGFLQVFDSEGTHDEMTRIQDEFENKCAQGIVSSGEEFMRVAQRYLDERRDKEIEALLESVSREAADEGETLPEGFHRGILADMGEVEREAAIAEEMARRQSQLGMALGVAQDGQTVPANRPPANRAHDASPLDELSALAASYRALAGNDQPRTDAERQEDLAVSCAIASVLNRGIVEIGEAYDQYAALAPSPIERQDFEALVRFEASYSDSYFGIWSHEGADYLQYYTMTPDYLAQSVALAATQRGAAHWATLRDELDYYESYRVELLESRSEIAPKPLSRTLLENAPLVELLRDENVCRLRRFLDEHVPDGQDDYLFANMAAQEFMLVAIETGSLGELYTLAGDLGIAYCCFDDTYLPRLITNVLNAMPSWENNGWSPQELYEQLTGRRMFYNEDGSVKKVGADEPCPCGSGKKYRDCCGK